MEINNLQLSKKKTPWDYFTVTFQNAKCLTELWSASKQCKRNNLGEKFLVENFVYRQGLKLSTNNLNFSCHTKPPRGV